MTVATYVFEVDWNNDGVFTGTGENVTADLLSIECRRGRDYASQLTGRATAGRLTATLKNVNGDYSSFNSSSPIAGNIVPGRQVRLRTTAPSAANLWHGYLVRIVPGGRVHGIPTVTLEAVGALSRLQGKKISPAAQASATTGTIMGAIWDAAGWPAGDRSVDTGQTTVGRWYVDEIDALQATREIEETELGFVLEDTSKNLVFEDRHHRLASPHTASVATFSDAAGATHPYQSIEQADPLREIYNDVVAKVAPLTAAGANSVLWTFRGTNPTIRAGESLTVIAEYPNPAVNPSDGAYVDSWATPVVGTDITQTGVANGDLAVATVKNANTMEITITNNHATATATLTLIQAQGDPVTRQEPVRITDSDATSQTAYGERTYRLPGPWIPDIGEALDFARYVVSRYKDPLPVLRLGFRANRSADTMTQALTRDISDRVTIVATGSQTNLDINDDFFIEAISHRISDKGTRHEVVFDLSDASGDAGYWVLGVSTLGETTKLAY